MAEIQIMSSIVGEVNKVCQNDSIGVVEIRTPLASWGVTAALTFLLPVVIIFGVVGSIISGLILRYTSLRLSSHFYLICLCVWDVLALLSMLPTFWAVLLLRPFYYYQTREASWIDFYLMTWGVCQVRLYLTFFLRTLDVYTIVAFTLERAFSVVRPVASASWCTVRSAKIIMAIIFVTSALINLPWLFSFSEVPMPCGQGRMMCQGNDILKINRFVEFFFLILFPGLLICLGNGVLISRMRRHHENHHHCERQITVRLIAISFAFVLLTFPLFIVVICLTFTRAPREGVLANLFPLTFFLYTSNMSVNFIVYCLTAMEFRTCVMALFKGRLGEFRVCALALAASTTGVTGEIEPKCHDNNKENVAKDCDKA